MTSPFTLERKLREQIKALLEEIAELKKKQALAEDDQTHPFDPARDTTKPEDPYP